MSYSAQRQDGKERRQRGGSVQGGKSQGHRGGRSRRGTEGRGADVWGKGERSKADAHVGKSTNLVTFSSNKAKDIQLIEIMYNILKLSCCMFLCFCQTLYTFMHLMLSNLQ